MKVKTIFISFMISIFLLSCGKTEPVADNVETTGITLYEAEDITVSSVTEKPNKIPDPVNDSFNDFFNDYFNDNDIEATIPWEDAPDAADIAAVPAQIPASPAAVFAQTPVNPAADSLTIAIDAGHQAKGNSEQEPIGPGANTTKAKVTSGTAGVSTKIPEYKLTLAVSLKLKDELMSRGYQVYMIRETHDVNISNSERAKLATDAEADIFVRIHADGSQNSAVNGILTLSPTANNPYVPQLYEDSYRLSKDILDAMVAATGAKNRGVSKVDNMSGINWATMPVTIVEMGLMTNPSEDEMMQTEEYQMKLAKGIADGIDNYFMDQ